MGRNTFLNFHGGKTMRMFKIPIYSFLCSIFFISVSFANSIHPPADAVVSASDVATNAGISILKQGGNAFDAAVAVAATLAVTEPYHSGIGGGGFWLLHTAKDSRDYFIDARETAPAAATANMYYSIAPTAKNSSLNGPLSAAIPAEPQSFAYIVRHYGKLSLATDLQPAIQAAEQGFKVDARYQNYATIRLEALRASKEAAAIFLRNNDVPPLGTIIQQKQLAYTLQKLAKQGPKGFYQGKIADQMVTAVDAGEGIWSKADLMHYKIKVRQPLVGYYHGIKVITVSPPSAGGLALITILNILQHYPYAQLDRVAQIHYAVEAMRFAFYDRFLYLGDPDFVSIPMQSLQSQQHIEAIVKQIHSDKATPSQDLVNSQVDTSPNTTHFSILDKEGNRVSATLTINNLFGSGFVAGNTGVLLNDEMDDFTTAIDKPNLFGVAGSKANIIAPNKRPLSSMTPTFLVSKNRIAILGSTGGSKIPMAVLWATLEFAAGHPVTTWVSVRRIHHQYLPDEIQYEKGALSPAEQAALQKEGYTLTEMPDVGNLQAILWNLKTNQVTAATDPRGQGSVMKIL
jgi:gamma-glutamyltranspeptidase/glutathione hydrolase